MPPSDWPMGNFCGGIILINDPCGRTQFAVGGASPEQVALGCMRNRLCKQWRASQQAELLRGSRCCFFLSSCSDHQLWRVIGMCEPYKPFPLHIAFAHGVCYSNRNQTRTLASMYTLLGCTVILIFRASASHFN